MTKIETNRPGGSSTKELKTSYTSLIASTHKKILCLTSRTSLSPGGCSGLFWFQLIMTNTCQLLRVRPFLFKQLKSQNCLAGPREQKWSVNSLART